MTTVSKHVFEGGGLIEKINKYRDEIKVKEKRKMETINDTTLTAIKMQMTEIEELIKEDDEITDAMLNPDGNLWVESEGKMYRTGKKIEPLRASSIIRLLAGYNNMIINEDNPEMSVKLPFLNGGRFHAIIPPVVSNPIFAIRFPPKNRLSLDILLDLGTITSSEYIMFENAVKNRKNILIAGATGSGKTTIANALTGEIKEGRSIIIEDTPEIISSTSYNVSLLTSEEMNFQQAVRSALRLRPDRIIVGDIRDGGTALGLCEVWLGHPGGIATIHASSASVAKKRIYSLMQEVVVTPDRELINAAIDLIIFVEKVVKSDKSVMRKVTQIIEKDKI